MDQSQVTKRIEDIVLFACHSIRLKLTPHSFFHVDSSGYSFLLAIYLFPYHCHVLSSIHNNNHVLCFPAKKKDLSLPSPLSSLSHFPISTVPFRFLIPQCMLVVSRVQPLLIKCGLARLQVCLLLVICLYLKLIVSCFYIAIIILYLITYPTMYACY